MFAVIRTGGKQYKVSKDDTLRVEKLAAKEGETLTLTDVLMVNDGKASKLGAALSGASVTIEIVGHERAPKILVFRKRRRQNYRRKNGHRQDQTVIKVTGIKAA